ncbi:glycosyltransferase family 2 protein [Methanobrevibacter sp. OttesenSCG-928-K11]|nr:glycosyltransferase family 2 protein [Methanobrevibacter sp. OttesenSCG-928-K11]MDL2270379.1 glycosyltransferase family 2 protein [Methanobrevibacter sp. OttesenSCG-928-I08]
MVSLKIIVPCYDEEKTLDIFYNEISTALNNLNNIHWSVLFINDGSKDNTLQIIKNLSINYENIEYLSFSRNFGKESAIYAGLENSTEDYVLIMDADLQDPPHLIPEMLKNASMGYDIVSTRRVSRKGEPIVRSFFARVFNKLINLLSDVEIVDGARDYKLITAEVKDSVLGLKEYNRFSKGIFQWIGFKNKWIEYENIERSAGETSWSFWSLFKYSISGIISFTTAPLHVSTIIGILFAIISFILIVIIVIKTLLFGDPVDGWPSTISIILFVGGIQLFAIGILGQYISKIYLEVKNRPHYIIKEKNIDNK